MLTISELASYAGVTVRAVRHYHAKGLLPEPERDRSGYRRYDAVAVAALIKIRTLAEAGVPLARVRELLAADETEFATAVVDIDRRLRVEIRERQRHRERIAQLAAGDNLALPPSVVGYLDRMRAVGISEQIVEGERDAWILVVATHSADKIDELMRDKNAQLDDPVVVELYSSFEEAVAWDPDDPRVEGLADRLAALIAASAATAGAGDAELEPGVVELLDSMFLDSLPIGARLLELLAERGWTGWTQLEAVDADD